MRKRKPNLATLIGAEWIVNVLHEADGWRVEDATLISVTGKVRAFARRPLGGRSLPSRLDALLAFTNWTCAGEAAREAA